MNKQKFIQCLRNPGVLRDNDLDELNQLVKQYPYFQVARALAAKAAKERNSKDAQRKIVSAAVYVTDRPLLKRFINDHLFFLDSKDSPAIDQKVNEHFEKERAIAAKKRRQLAGKRDETSENRESARQAAGSKEKLRKKLGSPKTRLQEELLETKPSETDIDQLIQEIYADMAELKKSRARFREVEKKIEEEDAINAALAKASEVPSPAEISEPVVTNMEDEAVEDIESDIAAIEPPSVKEEDTTEAVEESANASVTPKDTAPIQETAESEEESTPAPETPRRHILREQTHREDVLEPLNEEERAAQAVEKPTEKSIDKIRRIRNQELKGPDPSVAKVNKGRKAATKEEEEAPKAAADSASDEALAAKATDPAKEEKERIIDEFIHKNPSISPATRKEHAGKKEDLSQSSTKFKADSGTEYLAQIYVEQGKVERAISIYEELGLKFPEKRSYFASRIEELKSE